MSIQRRSLLTGLGAGLALAASPSRAGVSYPQQPVRLVIPFGRGGSTDSIARLIAAELSRPLGQEVVVDHVPGPDGVAAALSVMRAKPDGHVLLLATATGFSGAPVLRADLPFDPRTDFAPISRLGLYVFCLHVHQRLQVRTLDELAAHARANPRAIRCGNATSTARLLAAQWARTAGVELTPLALSGDADLERAVAAGQVDMMFAATGPLQAHVKAGTLRALATLLPQRSPLLPDVPTMVEAGGRLAVMPWGGLFAPKGTPPGVVERLNAEIRTLLGSRELAPQFRSLGFEPEASSARELADHVERQLQEWRLAAVDAGLKPP
jgi:tripartite-type tricarboxylate transporter receptor subunit TctC